MQPWEKMLRLAQAQGSLDATEGCRFPKLVPQILEALSIRVKLNPEQLATLKSVYKAGFDMGT